VMAAPGSTSHADALGNVAGVRARRGDWAGSAAAYDEALRIRRAISPDEAAIASLLWSLASNAERQGDLTLAAMHAAAAVAHAERTAPGGLVAARAYHVAARVALASGRTGDARRMQDRGLAIARALVPGSRVEVAALATLAAIDVRDGRVEAARDRYAAALAALDTQVRRLGAALDLEAGYVDAAAVQRPYVDTLLALGDDRRAYEVLESVRARAVLDRLAARDLTLGRADDAEGVARERRRLAREYDETLAQLAAVGGGEQAAALVERLRALRDRQAAAASALRRADGDAAGRLSPPAFSLAELQRALAPGTLALAYHLGDRPAVFVVTGEAFAVRRLDRTAADIADRIDRWRRLVERGRSGSSSDPALDAEADGLFDVLVGPAAGELRAATRLLVLPDGPLHGVSFAALRGPGRGAARRYLAEALPVTVAPSLTALATLGQRARRAVGELSVAVFGDVAIGAPATTPVGALAVRARLTEGLAPLPGSRREAEDVARVFAPRSAARLGDAATEAAVKRLPRGTGILHLASHALVNDASPLDSAIVLSPDGDGGNGLLQAWEVFDELRLDADLVVLSACDTGLGRTFGGEGLLGLTRAFQFAGARAVLASLWTAPDEATAGLMSTFYRHLRAGRPIAEALAAAQRELLARSASRHPYFWAGFVVDGAVH
jgi:CHAT domain-containing protein